MQPPHNWGVAWDSGARREEHIRPAIVAASGDGIAEDRDDVRVNVVLNGVPVRPLSGPRTLARQRHLRSCQRVGIASYRHALAGHVKADGELASGELRGCMVAHERQHQGIAPHGLSRHHRDAAPGPKLTGRLAPATSAVPLICS
jgi:hypothetical protein